ncbi:hypothetical protein HYY75_09955 [bacterium]|nr:hypothetical protein [bacterium]
MNYELRVKKISKILFWVLLTIIELSSEVVVQGRELSPPTNFYSQTGSLFDMLDPIGDDKGPGFYQYPLDSRLRRGTFDLTRFTVYEEGNMVTFVIQLREYILTEWPDSHQSNEQGFVAQMFDIYLDTDGKKGSGRQKAIPGRDLVFSEDMGWEKMILITPLSQFRIYEILKGKTDDLEFQGWIEDIILPDYLHIQGDKLIVRINKEFLGNPSPNWGYQCFVMGFSHVVSVNRLLNRDVRAFATKDDFGGGWDTYGDPGIIDCIMPEGQDQYQTLKAYKSQPFRGEIEYAKVPFVYLTKGDSEPDGLKPSSRNEDFTKVSPSEPTSKDSTVYSEEKIPESSTEVFLPLPQASKKTDSPLKTSPTSKTVIPQESKIVPLIQGNSGFIQVKNNPAILPSIAILSQNQTSVSGPSDGFKPLSKAKTKSELKKVPIGFVPVNKKKQKSFGGKSSRKIEKNASGSTEIEIPGG